MQTAKQFARYKQEYGDQSKKLGSMEPALFSVLEDVDVSSPTRAHFLKFVKDLPGSEALDSRVLE
jgi:hypothetical protein